MKLKKIIQNRFLDGYALKSYSQEGEDMILRRIYEKKPPGFYVDIGAHHPKRFSNTYYFYKRGWSGINIDATPGSMSIFKKERPRDINIETFVGTESGQVKFHLFKEPALNTTDSQLADIHLKDGRPLLGIVSVNVQPLHKILANHISLNQKIDFMSIDVEGADLEVLKSNNWQNFRPHYVLVEALGLDIEQVLKSEIAIYMHSVNYVLFAKTVNTVFFKTITE